MPYKGNICLKKCSVRLPAILAAEIEYKEALLIHEAHDVCKQRSTVVIGNDLPPENSTS